MPEKHAERPAAVRRSLPAPALSGAAGGARLKKPGVHFLPRRKAAHASVTAWAWTAAGISACCCGSIVFAGAFAIVFDSGAFCLLVTALCLLSAGDFGFLPFFGDDECGSEEIFQTDPCQFPVPGQTAGFFGEDNDLTGGELHEQPFPHIIRDGC